jgi:RND family efflux transporter MFP subunit
MLASGCRRAEAISPSAPTRGPLERAATSARLSVPEKVRFAPRIVATGTLKAQQAAPLAFRVAGTLRKIDVRRGQAVAEGALLGALDADQAEAALKQAEAGLAAGRAQARLAQDAWERMSRIRKEDGISEAQLVQAESQRDLAQAQLLSAEAQLQQARAVLSHHFIRAPFAGVVTRIPDGIGLTAASGVPVFVLESTRVLTLETSLTQEEAAEVRPGAAVTVVVPATGARTAEGTVRVVVPSVDAATNRVPVEVAVPNAEGRFMPHAFARALFPAGAERDALRVPAAALAQRDGAYSIWIAAGDGRARRLPVRLLDEAGDSALVDPGADWPEGARVIDAPPLGLADGAPVAEVAAR